MILEKITVPKNLTLTSSIDFVSRLHSLQPAAKYEFDFSQLKKIDPFSLLLVSSEIQRCRSRLSNSKFVATNYRQCTYPAHMGFFKAFGMDFGNAPGEAKGSRTYIPIHILDTLEIREEAKATMRHPAEVLEARATEIANVLTRGAAGDLQEVLTYCIREIFRNVIEHSQADQFGFCAQYLPSQSRVSFSLIDRGVGLKVALEENPTLSLQTDEDAIRAAMQPAISGKVYKGQKRKPKGE